MKQKHYHFLAVLIALLPAKTFSSSVNADTIVDYNDITVIDALDGIEEVSQGRNSLNELEPIVSYQKVTNADASLNIPNNSYVCFDPLRSTNNIYVTFYSNDVQPGVHYKLQVIFAPETRDEKKSIPCKVNISTGQYNDTLNGKRLVSSFPVSATETITYEADSILVSQQDFYLTIETYVTNVEMRRESYTRTMRIAEIRLIPIEEDYISVEMGNIYYNIVPASKTAQVKNTPNMYTGDIVIPESITYNGEKYDVTSIQRKAFNKCIGLKSISIPNNVTSIVNGAFFGCSGLSTITIPNSVTYIGKSAFEGCSGLISVSIPNSVTYIGKSAFEGCSGLISVSIPGSVTYFSDKAFSNCSALSSVTVNCSPSSIGSSLFEGCDNLIEAVFDCDTIKSLLYGVPSLKKIIVKENVAFINNGSFGGCKLENVLTKSINTSFIGAFPNATLQHAILYVPAGSFWDIVYESAWYQFNNIREIAAEIRELSPSCTYMLMDSQTFGYIVYDEVNKSLCIKDSHHQVDESNPNNSWQISNIDNKIYLYNIGAHKYAAMTSDENLILRDSPMALSVKNGDKGIMLSNSSQKQWNFVLNNNIEPDKDITSIDVTATKERQTKNVYNLCGNQVGKSLKGVNIVKMGDGTVKKVISK